MIPRSGYNGRRFRQRLQSQQRGTAFGPMLARSLAPEFIAVDLSELSRVVVDLRVGHATLIVLHRAIE